MIDTERIQQLACLDAAKLWFLAEMEAAEDPQSTVYKWALHPEIGPTLKGRDWLLTTFGLQEPMRSVYNRLRTMSLMSQV